MASLTEIIVGLLTPQVREHIAKSLKIEPALLDKGISLVSGLLVGGLAKTASSPQGADKLSKVFSEHKDEGLLDRIKSIFSGEAPSTPADHLQGMLGGGVNAVAGALSRKLGFNVAPLLGMLAPAVTGKLAALFQEKGMDASSLSTFLQSEADAFSKDPANAEAIATLDEARLVGEKAVALRETYSDEEWRTVHLAPAAAMLLVASASPSGFGGTIKELKAAAGAVEETLLAVDPGSLLGTAFGSGLTQDELTALKARGPSPENLLTLIKQGVDLVSSKNPADLAAYRHLINHTARKLAEATKEGGFLGFGGTLVSKEEEEALGKIAATVG